MVGLPLLRENFVSGTGGGLDDDGCGEDEHVSPGSSVLRLEKGDHSARQGESEVHGVICTLMEMGWGRASPLALSAAGCSDRKKREPPRGRRGDGLL